VRLNTMPLFAGAGHNRKLTFTPVCNPIPESETAEARVCCESKIPPRRKYKEVAAWMP